MQVIEARKEVLSKKHPNALISMANVALSRTSKILKIRPSLPLANVYSSKLKP